MDGVDAQGEASGEANGEGAAGGRRRRNRGRRGGERREGGEGTEGTAEGAEAAGVAQRNEAEPEASSVVAPIAPPAAELNTPALTAEAVETQVPQAAAEPARAAVAEASVAVTAETVATPVAAPFVLPLAELQGIAQAAGLEWVNSDADKIRAVQEAIAREPRPVHVPRERKPAVVVDDGPLILVETRKDLSQVSLPFEQNA